MAELSWAVLFMYCTLSLPPAWPMQANAIVQTKTLVRTGRRPQHTSRWDADIVLHGEGGAAGSPEMNRADARAAAGSCDEELALAL